MSFLTSVNSTYSFSDRDLNFVCKGPSGLYQPQEGPYKNEYAGRYDVGVGVFINTTGKNQPTDFKKDFGEAYFFSASINQSGIPYFAFSYDSGIKIFVNDSEYIFEGSWGNLFFNGILNPNNNENDLFCFYSSGKNILYRIESENFALERICATLEKTILKIHDLGFSSEQKTKMKSLFVAGRYEDGSSWKINTTPFSGTYLEFVGIDFNDFESQHFVLKNNPYGYGYSFGPRTEMFLPFFSSNVSDFSNLKEIDSSSFFGANYQIFGSDFSGDLILNGFYSTHPTG